MAMGGAHKNFLENMIPHQQNVVDMTTMGLKKASRSELKAFAQGVIDLSGKRPRSTKRVSKQ